MMEINKVLSSIGCCQTCILRYIGSKNADFYADAVSAFKKLDNQEKDVKEEDAEINGSDNNQDDMGPSRKRQKLNPCICCLGLLQKDFWPDMLSTIKRIVEEKNYDSKTFACALTSPTCLFLREHSINLYLQEVLPKWKPDIVTSLKEAWKWSFGAKMAEAIGKTMDSGAVCQYMIKANMAYAHDTAELESLRLMCPEVFAQREREHRKFRGESFTRKGVETMLSSVSPQRFRQHFKCPPAIPETAVECSGVECLHQPIYLAGRYCKYSRELCQTPWILEGKRMMDTSIQDIIFKPVAELFKIPLEEATNRLKFLSSGREDVDVRCLGMGRPFAVEISDPKGARLDAHTLASLTAEMGKDEGLMKVRDLQIVGREELATLKMGEITKSKTYLALCVKLEENYPIVTNSECDLSQEQTNKNNVEVLSRITQEDLDKLNRYTNGEDGEINIQQKTPLRVLHRRPLLVRERKILKMEGTFVNDKPNLFLVEMTTEAGTYIKEFVHGDFGRTSPSLTDILGFKVDILALDVKSVNLDWPKIVENIT